MIDVQLEEMTIKEAVDAGLVEAIKRGEAKVCGSYELTQDGYVEFDQNNFMFKDKNNVLRVGRFKDNGELVGFWKEFDGNF